MSVNSPPLTDARLSTLTEKYPMHVILRLVSVDGHRRSAPGVDSTAKESEGPKTAGESTQQRKRARDQKLLERELEYAAAQGWHFLSCPCTLCLRENRSGLIPRSYSRCVRRNGRCPWF